MFETQTFIDSCKNCVGSADSHKKIRVLLENALQDCDRVRAALGEPEQAGFDLLYRSPELTIINFVWAPGMHLYPHNHNMWAVIGIYSGIEQNRFYVRKDGVIVEQNQKLLQQGDVSMLGRDIIHSVTNPGDEPTGGIHIYGGDFVAVERSQWDGDLMQEAPYDMEQVKAVFADANRAWHGQA